MSHQLEDAFQELSFMVLLQLSSPKDVVALSVRPPVVIKSLEITNPLSSPPLPKECLHHWSFLMPF